MAQQPLKLILSITAVMLLLAIPSIWPYGYYQVLRVVVTIVSIIAAHSAFSNKAIGWTWAFAVLAILFNPIAPVYLDKGIWVGIDLAAAVALIAFVFNFKRSEP